MIFRYFSILGTHKAIKTAVLYVRQRFTPNGEYIVVSNAYIDKFSLL